MFKILLTILVCLSLLGKSCFGQSEEELAGKGLSKEFKEIIKDESIFELDLGGKGIGDKGVKELAELLPNLLNIEILSLMDNGISDTGLIELARILPQTRIEYLYLSENNFSALGLKALGKAIKKCIEMRDEILEKIKGEAK